MEKKERGGATRQLGQREPGRQAALGSRPANRAVPSAPARCRRWIAARARARGLANGRGGWRCPGGAGSLPLGRGAAGGGRGGAVTAARPGGEGARQDAARSPHAAAPAGPALARVWEEGTHHRFLPHYGASGAQGSGGELTPLVTSLSVALPQPRVPDGTFPAAAVGLLSLPWLRNADGPPGTFFLRQTSVFQPRKRGEVIFPRVP